MTANELDLSCYNESCENHDKDKPLSCSFKWHHGPHQCEKFLTYCPFCPDGGQPRLNDITAIREAWCIACDKCGTAIGFTQPSRSSTPKKACELWNRRKI